MAIKIKKEKGIIRLLRTDGNQTMAATSIGFSPVNEARLPQTSAIYIDEAEFDKMCLARVKEIGDKALLDAAATKPGKEAAILALTCAFIGCGETGMTMAVELAEETYELMTNK